MFFYVERFCLSCHGDALWADTSGGNRLCWLILLLHVCMCSHVAHINTHTHAHTDQCTVWCLWRMGVAYWTSTSATQEHCHAQKYFTKRGAWAPENKMVRHLCPKWPLDELTGCVFLFFFLFFLANTMPYTVYKSVVSQMDTKGKTFLWFFLHRIMLLFFLSFFLNWTKNFFYYHYYYLKPNLAVFQCLHRISLICDFSTLPYCFLKSWSGDGIVSPLI